MRDCLKASETNNIVSLPAASGSYVMSSRFLTVNLEPFEFTNSLLGSLCLCGLTLENATHCHALKREEELLSLLCFKLLLDLSLKL